MRRAERIIVALTMMLAFCFGFADYIWPDVGISFHRLHVFLFNLCSGGSLILFHCARSSKTQAAARFFFSFSILYSLFAAMGWFALTLVVSVPLAIAVEVVRVRLFGFWPWGFFKTEISVSEKFELAALLCLSLAIVIASLVIVNNEYVRWLSYPKLTVDVFFLGYSFPVSLITMSIMFRFIPSLSPESHGKKDLAELLGESSFWLVNLGVIVFFVFIIAGWYAGEIAASVILTVTVSAIFALFLIKARSGQQKAFLLSGMSFLLLTAITGVLYILKDHVIAVAEIDSFLLLLHGTISLYGWNLCGLLIIIRFDDFPIRLNSALFIVLHWSVVLILSPLAKFHVLLSAMAVVGWMILLGLVFFGAGRTHDL